MYGHCEKSMTSAAHTAGRGVNNSGGHFSCYHLLSSLPMLSFSRVWLIAFVFLQGGSNEISAVLHAVISLISWGSNELQSQQRLSACQQTLSQLDIPIIDFPSLKFYSDQRNRHIKQLGNVLIVSSHQSIVRTKEVRDWSPTTGVSVHLPALIGSQSYFPSQTQTISEPSSAL